jgi:hypothetical protein
MNDYSMQDIDSGSNFAIHFKEMKLALRGFCKDRIYVWPFNKLITASEKDPPALMIV